MRRFISRRLLILGAILLTLEYCFSPFFPLLSGRPDFLYLLVLDYAFFWSWELVPFFALGVGFLRDVVGGHLFGIETASLTATSLLLSLGIPKLERENFWVRGGIVFIFVGLTEALSFSLGVWLEGLRVSSLSLMNSVFWTTFYTVILSPAFFWFTNRWFKRVPILKQYELFSK